MIAEVVEKSKGEEGMAGRADGGAEGEERRWVRMNVSLTGGRKWEGLFLRLGRGALLLCGNQGGEAEWTGSRRACDGGWPQGWVIHEQDDEPPATRPIAQMAQQH